MDLDTSAFDEAVAAAPTDELDTSAFDAPGVADTMSANPKSVGKLESFIRGAAQGASFDFGDEITGAVEAALSDKTYEQARDESRAAYKEAQAQNPISYFGGNVAGGMAIPGLGTGAIAAKGLIGGSKALQLAKAGAIAGGLTGAGASEDTGMGLVKDTAAGATLGGVLSPMIGQVIPSAIGRTAKAAKTLPMFEDLGAVFSKAQAGESLAGKETLARLTGELKTDIEQNLFPFINRTSKDVISEAYDLASKQARTEGRTADITDLINNAQATLNKKNIPPEEANKIIDTLKRFGGSEEQVTSFKQINPMTRNPEELEILKQVDNLKARQDVKEMRSQLDRAGEPSLGGQQPGVFQGKGPAFGTDVMAARSQSASDTLAPLKTSGGRGEFSAIKPVTSEVLTTPQQTVDDLHNLKNVLEDFATTETSAGREAIAIKKEVDDLIANMSDKNALAFANRLREIKSEAVAKLGLADVATGMDDLSRQSRNQSANAFLEKITNAMGTNKGMVARQDIGAGFDALKMIDPSKAGQLESGLSGKARDVYLSRQMNQPAVLSPDPLTTIAGGTKGLVYRSADMAGKMSRGITESTPGQLAAMAADLVARGQTKYAEMLKKASLAEPSKRQALLFVLAQDPSFREIVRLGE